MGNAFYHVGGGVAALTMQKDRATPSGIFVGPGALGLAIGAFIGGRGVPVLWPFAVLLLLAAIAVGTSVFPESNEVYRKDRKPVVQGGLIVATLLLFSVALRSLIGFAAGSMWHGNQSVLTAFVVAAACGKALGGVISDRAGWIGTGTAALLFSGFILANK